MLSVNCPHCGELFNFRESSVGKLYHCRACRGRIELFREKPAFNHAPHLVLTILSCGWWGFVWLLALLAHAMKVPTVYARAK
jgi:DNA-directed RNA polymerase subunit RPC12/RpoP